MSEDVRLTGTYLSLVETDGAGLKWMVRKAVARALQNQEGHWRTDDKRDARDVAEVACHMMLDEMKQALVNMERMKEFVRDSEPPEAAK